MVAERSFAVWTILMICTGCYVCAVEIKCYGKLGCLKTTMKWYNNYRPSNPEPAFRRAINTTFTLYTHRHPKGEIIRATVRSIDNSSFNPRQHIKFITHGFLANGHSPSLLKMARALLNYDDWNVILVDWSGGSGLPYLEAAVNTRVVALEVAYLIRLFMVKHNVKPEHIHLIGHSLGAHLSGYVGARIKGLGRITGLDPAEPLFQWMPTVVRLDPTDAKFVDVIHTNAESMLKLGYGMEQLAGHVDFYPNGGLQQPGCKLGDVPGLVAKKGMGETRKGLVSCSHSRAVELFTESIYSKCAFVGYQCTSYQSFLQGDCATCGPKNDNCAVMGLRADATVWKRQVVPFYLRTDSEAPLCVCQYDIRIQLVDEQRFKGEIPQDLSISLYGEGGVATDVELSKSSDEVLELGKTLNFLAIHHINVGHVTKAELKWTVDPALAEKLCFFCPKSEKLLAFRIAVVNLGIASYYESRQVDLCNIEEEAVTTESSLMTVFKPCTDYNRIAQNETTINITR